MGVKLGPQVVSINKSVVDRLLSVINQNSNGSKKLAILGLSYKPGTHIVEESQSIMLAQKLVEEGYEVSVHDPKAIDTAKDILGESVYTITISILVLKMLVQS
ncbi:MAG: UDP binding domain-containing protein [Planctomycetota bacterium]